MIARHVVPAGKGWLVEKEHAQRPSAKTATQAEAITCAARIVANNGGGHVVIHSGDGSVQERRTITTTGQGAHPGGRSAAHRATQRHSMQLRLPLVGLVALPPPDQLAYLGGITALVALGILEWPIAAVLGAGHLLATDRNNKIIADFGEALERA